MVSEKQIQILTKNGYTQEQITKMSYQDVSRVIGEILSKNKPKETVVNVEPKNGQVFHLSPEECRARALESALVVHKKPLDDVKEIEVFWKTVHNFEKYINGE